MQAAEERLYPPRVTPPERPLSLVRFVPRFIANPIAALPAPVYREPIFTYQLGSSPIAWVTSPTLIKTILLDEHDSFRKTPLEKRILGPLLGNGILMAEGDDWRWQRQVVAPLFRHQELIGYVPAMTAAAGAMLDEWRRASHPLREIDRDMTRTTFRVITDTILPADADVAGAIERSHDDYLQPISWPIVYGVLQLPEWLPHPYERRMRRAERDLRAAIARLLAARRAMTQRPDDLLTRLLAARHPDSGQPMADELLIDNLATFLTAGHATTAMAMTWILYLLARVPEWQERIASEVSEVAGTRPIEPGDLDRLRLTMQVIKEAMRLYPPAPVLTRMTAGDLRLGGVRLAKGTLVVVPIYAVHRHEKLWADPDRFDPERFAEAAEAARSRYQYMPFGAGPRICIGMSFAMIEAGVLTASLVRAARFERLPGCDPEPISRVTLRPKGGMRLIVRPRP